MKAIGRGGIFAAYKTFPYRPSGSLFGQLREESCAAAVCRMLLQDDGIEIPEAYLRDILETDLAGTDLSEIPRALEILAARRKYVLSRLGTIDELRNKTRHFPAIAAVKVKNTIDYHTLLIDEINEDFVFVRDPLPVGQGKSYRVKIDDFTDAWIRKKSGLGLAIVVI